mmetsp:Transcript_20830/g.52209  ORF Transcript_20830/g.52209 Transcript_20830/m.52209 type:complete len:282 (+) Transcript_20830:54-899(+)
MPANSLKGVLTSDTRVHTRGFSPCSSAHLAGPTGSAPSASSLDASKAAAYSAILFSWASIFLGSKSGALLAALNRGADRCSAAPSPLPLLSRNSMTLNAACSAPTPSSRCRLVTVRTKTLFLSSGSSSCTTTGFSKKAADTGAECAALKESYSGARWISSARSPLGTVPTVSQTTLAASASVSSSTSRRGDPVPSKSSSNVRQRQVSGFASYASPSVAIFKGGQRSLARTLPRGGGAFNLVPPPRSRRRLFTGGKDWETGRKSATGEKQVASMMMSMHSMI